MDNHESPPGLRQRFRRRFMLVVLREEVSGQRRHVDPEDPATAPPATDHWTAAQRRASVSHTMALFSDALRPPTGGSVREGVIGDLAAYHHLNAAEVIDRCLGWEETSAEEWEAAPRDSADGLAEFYDSVESWAFDLLWYAMLQSAGYSYSETVVIADRVEAMTDGGRLLDLGSGVGATAALFAALGYDVTLSDVSAPLLNFARWRLEQRGVKAAYIHLPAELPDSSYDLITAFDVIAHMPDVADTARRLRRAIRPGGLFVANFDVRRRSRPNAWHLHEDDLPLRWAIQRAGFTPVGLVDGIMWTYRADATTGARFRLRTAIAWLRLASPPARGLRWVRRLLARAALVAVQRRAGRKEPI